MNAFQSFFGLGQSAELSIVLDNDNNSKYTMLRMEDNSFQNCPLFYDGETVSGEVVINLRKGKLEHQGIRIEFIGQIEIYYDRGNQNDFLHETCQLARAGELTQSVRLPFKFVNVSKPYESYTGVNVKLRYYLRAVIMRRLSDITRELDVAVHTFSSYSDNGLGIKMEVGIEDCLHIEFEYNRAKYHLSDVIVGGISFMLVRLKLKSAEIAIIRRETVGNGANPFHENETIGRFEIMDGAPVKGESIPIRFFLQSYEHQLTPTMKDIARKFSVRYYLNLVLIDEEDRRYFKQQEIILWRKLDKQPRKTLTEQLQLKQLLDDPNVPGPSGISTSVTSTSASVKPSKTVYDKVTAASMSKQEQAPTETTAVDDEPSKIADSLIAAALTDDNQLVGGETKADDRD